MGFVNSGGKTRLGADRIGARSLDIQDGAAVPALAAVVVKSLAQRVPGSTQMPLVFGINDCPFSRLGTFEIDNISAIRVQFDLEPVLVVMTLEYTCGCDGV